MIFEENKQSSKAGTLGANRKKLINLRENKNTMSQHQRLKLYIEISFELILIFYNQFNEFNFLTD